MFHLLFFGSANGGKLFVFSYLIILPWFILCERTCGNNSIFYCGIIFLHLCWHFIMEVNDDPNTSSSGFLKSLRFYKLGQLLVLTIYLLLGQFFENFVLHEYIVQSGFLYSWWNSLKVLSFCKWIPSYFRVFRYILCAQYLKMKKVEFLVFPKQSAEWIFF